VVMNNAIIAQTGTPRELYEAPDTAFVADFIGEANIIPCEIVNIENDRARVKIERLEVLLPSRGLKRGPAKLAVRPNRIKLTPADGPPAFAGQLEKVVYVGSHWEYAVATAAGELFVKTLDGDSTLAVGGPVAVSFAAEGPVLLPG
jgi:iron(III) transport system ATP-binding protein